MMSDSFEENLRQDNRAGEKGWALLGLLLALTIMSIFMVSAITPNVTGQVQRSKEEEMVYRGDRISKAIARYYNNGLLGGIQIMRDPPYGKLTELKKLRDGVIIGVKEWKFIRPSEMIDPMSGLEWEPVRARDPRIMKVLQAWAAENQAPIPQMYMWLVGTPQKMKLANPSGDGDKQSSGADGKGSQAGSRNQQNPDPNDVDPEVSDDHDPLGHIFGSGMSDGPGSTNIPIVGVAPRVKGKAMIPLYGLDRYEDWVFIFVPLNQTMPGTFQIPPGGNNTNSGRQQTNPLR